MITVDHIELQQLWQCFDSPTEDSHAGTTNQQSIDLLALGDALNRSAYDLLFFVPERTPVPERVRLPSGADNADILVGRYQSTSNKAASDVRSSFFIEGTCIGLSLFDRFLSRSHWKHDYSLSLSGKIFNRSFLLAHLERLTCEQTYIQQDAFVLTLFLLAEKVWLLDFEYHVDDSDVLKGYPLLLDSESTLFALNATVLRLRDFSGYFLNAFSKWLATAYIDTLLMHCERLGERDAFDASQSLKCRLRQFPELYSYLFLFGIPQLSVETRMSLNSLTRHSEHNEGCLPINTFLLPEQKMTVLDNKGVSLIGGDDRSGFPLVSIITVVRNLYTEDRIGFFESMLDSVATQDYPSSRLEHLVVDGASVDGSLEYLTGLWYAGRITRLISGPDTSVYNAMNKAMSYLDGDCFLFLNSDDFLAPDAVSHLAKTLFDESADYAFADAWQIDDRNNKVGVVKGEIDSAWFKVPYCHQTLMCRTFPLSRHRFDESYKITMMKYALDLFVGPYKSAYVPKKLAYYRIGDGVSSAPVNRSRYLEETYRVKDYSADMLGLSRELYEEVDQAWRRVTSQRQYEQLASLVDDVRADMPDTELTEVFSESVKRFGQYRLEQHREKHAVDQPAPVRLALFNSHAYGGAGSAVLRLHLALREVPGIRPTLVTRDLVDGRVIPGSRIIEEPENGWNARQGQVRIAPGSTQFTVDEGCIPSEVLDELIASHDVFSLQWTARMLSVRDIGRIVDSGKPVFITVRDMEPITGGCHYFHGCSHWRYRQCRDCPQIVRGDKRLVSDTFAEKLKVLKRLNVSFVALSEISETVLRQSPIAYENPIIRIGNGFDPDTFRILDRRQARQALGLEEAFADRYLIGMMPSFSSTVKGFDVVLSVLQEAEQQSAGFGEGSGLLVAGYPGESDDLGINLPMEAIGALGDAGALNLFYSACDLIVVPSREETFSNTVAEALLCGTPVFGAMAGAIPEMITDEVNGRLFSHDWDNARIAEILLSCCEKDFSPEVCRASIMDFFSQRQQVARYVELFSQPIVD